MFKVDPATGQDSVLYAFTGEHDGGVPSSGVLLDGRYLFGTTMSGIRPRYGTVFRVNPATGVEKTKYRFKGGVEGEMPNGLTLQGSLPYGTTQYGGSSEDGLLYDIDPVSGAVTTVLTFAGVNGVHPEGTMVSQGGMLYGVTLTGGAYDQGCVFSFDPATNTETVLHSFKKAGSGYVLPVGSLIYANNSLFGTTETDGAAGAGTVFRIDPQTGGYTVIHSFAGKPDGATPLSRLLFENGRVYGTTFGGGASGLGTVFAIDLSTRVETTLYGFTGGADGSYPKGGLIDNDGVFYGTTSAGGASGYGTVFSLVP